MGGESLAPVRRAVLTAAVIWGVAAMPASATAGSLPATSSGTRPGPEILYQPAPQIAELSVKGPFRAAPLLVSGTDAYREGEYLYQDYLWDDRGANTVPGGGNRGVTVQPTAGDVLYPTAERFGRNAADLVEFRVKPTADAVVYRVTLHTARDRDAAVVGIGIDTDRSGGVPTPWPRGAGMTSPGLDAFITAWGTGGEVQTLPAGQPTGLPDGAVQMDTETNQMTIRVPRSRAGMDPGNGVWRYVAGVGLWDGDGFAPVPARRGASDERAASGSDAVDAPGVFNLAFRFDEPQAATTVPPYDTAPGIGNWYEEKQAHLLRQRSSGDLFADVDFGALARGEDRDLHPPRANQARIYPTSLAGEEGITPEGQYRGPLQTYHLRVPPPGDRKPGLTLGLHGATANHTQYAVISPNYLRQLGDERNSLVVTPMGGTGSTEAAPFEAWADVARNFELDSENVAISGYSAGGYASYKWGVLYPDLFGRAFPIVGAARLGANAAENTNFLPFIGSARWIPYMAWNQAVDELAPWIGARLTQDRFNEEGLRSQLWTFPAGDHFTPAYRDEWGPGRDFLDYSRVVRDPSRVDYGIMPAADRPRLGLVANHAYWLSDLTLRDASGDPARDPARGFVAARSLAHGEGDPATRLFTGSHPGPPAPAAIDGSEWTAIEQTAPRNELLLSLTNLASVTVDGRRARLRISRPLTVTIESDGAARVRLDLPLPSDVVSTRIEGGGVSGAREVALDRRGATLQAGGGRHTYVLQRIGGRFVISRRTTRMSRRGVVPVRVSCRTPLSCSGVLRLRLGKRELGRRVFALPTRRRGAIVNVTLNARERRIAKRLRSFRVSAIATVGIGESSGGKVKTSFRVRVR